MIIVVHGGQTGVDRGAHEGAIANGWLLSGYMPRDRRDELGLIPADVAQFLVPHASSNYAARTEANVQMATAALIVVRDARDPRSTPGTAKTIALADRRRLLCTIADPSTDAAQIARWIWSDLLTIGVPLLPLDGLGFEPAPLRLVVAGPRESKWPGARTATAALLRQVGDQLAEIRAFHERKEDLPPRRR